MADIRQSPLLDDFQRPDETPIALPWRRDFSGWADAVLREHSLASDHFPPAGLQSYFSELVMSGSASGGPVIETWGLAGGSPALSDAWRFGLLEAGEDPNGYLLVTGQGVTGTYYDLRRYDAGAYTSIGGASGTLTDLEYALMRLNGGDVEIWKDNLTSGAGPWSLVCSVSDPNHRTGLYPHFGATGIETGWKEVGGGAIVKTQIYRYVSN